MLSLVFNMSWHYDITTTPGTLSQAEQQENALEIYNAFKDLMTVEAISGLLGNIQRECSMNPALEGPLLASGRPIGLIQWYPPSLLTDWATSQAYNWYDGEAQCLLINAEGYFTDEDIVWLPRNYQYTWDEWKALTNVETACLAYEDERERSGDDAQGMALRVQYANEWYQFLIGYQPIQYTPRLTDAGMRGNPWWYSNGNVFYANGYGLPNCTCYAYGRYAEIQNNPYVFANLPTGDAGTWYESATNFERGSTPKLGSVICWKTSDPSTGAPGHVAIVEVINQDGSIVISESGWNSWYFNTETLYPQNGYCSSWMSVNSRKYYCQGFIYNEVVTPIPPTPPTPTPTRKKGMPLWMLLRYSI